MIPLGNEVWGFMPQTPQCKPCFDTAFNRSDDIRTCLLRLSAATQGQDCTGSDNNQNGLFSNVIFSFFCWSVLS